MVLCCLSQGSIFFLPKGASVFSKKIRNNVCKFKNYRFFTANLEQKMYLYHYSLGIELYRVGMSILVYSSKKRFVLTPPTCISYLEFLVQPTSVNNGCVSIGNSLLNATIMVTVHCCVLSNVYSFL